MYLDVSDGAVHGHVLGASGPVQAAGGEDVLYWPKVLHPIGHLGCGLIPPKLAVLHDKEAAGGAVEGEAGVAPNLVRYAAFKRLMNL